MGSALLSHSAIAIRLGTNLMNTLCHLVCLKLIISFKVSSMLLWSKKVLAMKICVGNFIFSIRNRTNIDGKTFWPFFFKSLNIFKDIILNVLLTKHKGYHS